MIQGGLAWASRGLRVGFAGASPGFAKQDLEFQEGMHLVRRLKTFEATFEQLLKTNTERQRQKHSHNHHLYQTLSLDLLSRNAFACVKSRRLRVEASQAVAD